MLIAAEQSKWDELEMSISLKLSSLICKVLVMTKCDNVCKDSIIVTHSVLSKY